MKKLLLALLVALCAAFGLIGFAACDDATEPDGSGTDQEQPAGPDEKDPDDTNPDDKDPDDEDSDDQGSDDEDSDDQDPDDDTPVETPCTVTVNCGYGGNYELSKQAPYTLGDEVTLTVTPNAAHNVKSVTVNGADVTEELVGGKYTFTLSANVEISIEFSVVISRDLFVGTWDSIVSAGTASDELVIGADSFTFNEKSYALTETEDGFAFTVTEGSDVYNYSFTLEEVSEGKYILVLTVVTSETTLTEYCTKVGVDYSVSFPTELQGDWDAGPANYPISIEENKLTIGSDTAIVLFYNAQTTTYMLLSGGIEYTLVWNEDETLTLTIVGDESSASVYTKAIPPEEAFFPQFAGYYYTNGEHSVQIGDDGAFSFDGTTYSVIPVDSSDPTFGYTFRKNGDLWHIIKATAEQFLITDANYSAEIVCRYVTGDEAYTITVTYTGGENGTCTITPPAKGGNTYAAYELVTVTITANTGYHLQQVYLNGGSDITDEFEDGSYTFYISRNTTIEIKFISEQVAESIFSTDFIGKIFYGEDLNVFSVKYEYDKVTLTIESVQYVFTIDEITVTDSTSATFTFHVTIEKYGDVTVQCQRSYGFANFTVSKADGTVLGRTRTDKAI